MTRANRPPQVPAVGRPAQELAPALQAPLRIADIINTLSTHPHWAQHPGELWGRVLAGLRNSLPHDSYNAVCGVLVEVWKSAPGVQEGVVQFDLLLDHRCSAGACADGTCTLCVNSASRPCPRLFKSKYLLRDGIVPACGAGAAVSVVKSGSSGDRLSSLDLQKLPPILFQVCALPWAYYKDNKDQLPWDTIHKCKTIIKEDGNPAEPETILGCKEMGHLEQDGFVSFPHALEAAQGIPASQLRNGGTVKLPEVFFPRRSAEALLEGKRPQLVLVVRAVHATTGAPISNIRPAASPPFHVATRRTRGNEKAYIPSTDQEVRVLEHIGDACIDKLKSLHEHARGHPDIVLPTSIPEGKVLTVDHMLAVVSAVENDKTAESKLFLKWLKLNDDRLAELKEQLKRAVRPDSQLRIFYCGTYPTAPLPGLFSGAVDVGLIFTCTRGTVDLHEGGICGVVMRSHDSNQEAVVPRDHLIQEPHLKPLLLRHARRAWCTSGHPGWGFYTFQGRGTSRMPPEGAGLYSVDPSRIPCFTPDEYADDVADDAARDPGARDTSGGGSQKAQELSARSVDVASASAAHRSAARAPEDGRASPQRFGRHGRMSCSQYALGPEEAAGEGARRVQAQQPASPGAALAAATLALAQAAVTARAAPHRSPDHEPGPAAVPLCAALESLAPPLARSPLGGASAAGGPPVSWMNTHGLAHAGTVAARSTAHGPPPALFQPPTEHTPGAGSVRPRSPASGGGAQAHKRTRRGTTGNASGSSSGVHGGADMSQPAGSDAGLRFFPSISSLSGELGVSQNNPHLSSMLRAPGLQSSAATSGDLGPFAFGSDSLPAGTPTGSIELAV